jgi:DHA2 family multidrug resistance protein
VATLTDNLARVHLAHIKETLPAVSAQAYNYIQHTSSILQIAGSDAVSANSQAYALLAKNMSQQAYIQAYNDVFLIMACFLLIAVVAVLLIRKPVAKSDSDQPNEMH